MSRRLRRALAGAAVLVGAVAALRSSALQRADVRLGDAVRRVDGPVAGTAVTATTDLGSLYAVAGISGVLALKGQHRAAVDVAVAGLAGWTVAQWAKRGVERERPYQADGVRRLIREPTGSSFPSGHAAVATAVAAVLADHGPPGRRALPYGVAAYVAASRVHLGVHYPTDVVGGAGLGLLLAAAYDGRARAAAHSLVTSGRWPGVGDQGGAGLPNPTR